ncbi:MAG: type I glyceraldehyde-3-phosphate dehydrogenase [Bdellovibrionaceae bacterium]|nr:type I glyceraldehyde-3-phosphate dehydrogenase [Pseudobdellovibrionaceae bacterium]
MAKLRVAINGFGRIGRVVTRAAFDRVEIVAINNSSGTPEAHAHLLKYDSSHGTFAKSVSSDEKNVIIEGKKIPIFTERDPSQLPWGDLGVDVVFECTGAFKDSAENKPHLQAGAKKVIVSAPAKVDKTIVYGVNHKSYDPKAHHILSNASCTTNCLAPVAKVLQDQFGIEKGLMTTVHAFTNDQRILDNHHSDYRRARTASTSMIPTTTGAAKAVGEVLPELKGKIHGISVRVPTPNVSLVDFNVQLLKDVSVDDVNNAFIKASEGELKGVLACEKNELVSIDFNGHPASSIVDIPSTVALDKRFIKVLSWYDNEFGFSSRMVDLALYMNSVEAISGR